MAKRRPKKRATRQANSQHDTATKPQVAQLGASVAVPPSLVVLPQRTSPNARILTLPNPASGAPSSYYICPDHGFYEFTRVAAPKRECRSWLIAPIKRALATERGNMTDAEEREEGQEVEGKDAGYVLQQPDLFVATPIDPLFILLPALAGSEEEAVQERMTFLTCFDYLDRLWNFAPALKQLMRGKDSPFGTLEQKVETRLAAVCEQLSMGEGEDVMYRLSIPLLLAELLGKSKAVVEKGLPRSLEEKFVREVLEVSVRGVRGEESGISIAVDEATARGAEAELGFASDIAPSISASTSQTTTTTTTTTTAPQSTISTATSISTAATPVVEPAPNNAPANVLHLLRLRTALTYILTSYIPPTLRDELERLLHQPASLSTEPDIDFTPLNARLAHIARLKAEAQALRSLSDNIGRKRSADEGDEEAMARAGSKRRRKEEEEVRRKNTSRGVKQLEKVDRSGMRKLSSFFGKAAVQKGE